jgi:hypothetical protein
MKEMFIKTPFYVWGILVYLLIIGAKATKDRIVNIKVLFIAPIIFTVVKYEMFLKGCMRDIIAYLLSFIVVFYVSYFFSIRKKIEWVDQHHLKLEGSFQPLILFLSFFLMKYAFGVLNTLNSERYAPLKIYEIFLTAAFSGFMLAKPIAYNLCKKNDGKQKVKVRC